MKMVKEDEYGCSTFYTCMNMEHSNLSKSFHEGEWVKREINVGDKLNCGYIYISTDI
jgi:hypothetical protein